MKLLIKLDTCWHVLLNQEDLSENNQAAQSLPVLPVLFTRCVHIFAQLLPACIAAITALIGKGEPGSHSWEPIQHFPSFQLFPINQFIQLSDQLFTLIDQIYKKPISEKL